jgi:hypothetical protein
MNAFHRLLTGVNVEAVKFQLMLHPELWDVHQERKKAPGSPHSAMSDIWIRWREGERGEHAFLPEWMPAWHVLPALRPIVFGLMSAVGGTFLGGVLITRIPPGGSILPHDDRGTWHAENMNVKLYVPIFSNAGCVNVCEQESVVMAEGEAWYFDNLRTHSVENHGDSARVTLIVCMRVE